MKLRLTFLVFLLGTCLALAQKLHSIYGVVLDFHDKSPLKNTKVNIGDDETFSDDEGRFVIRGLPSGVYKIRAEHEACEVYETEVQVSDDVQLTLNMEHHAREIEQIKILGMQQNVGTMTVHAYDAKDIARKSTENLGNLISGISGVSSLQTGANISKPVIHGLYGSRISIINHEVKMAEQEWGVEHAPSIEPTFFDRIEVVKGAGMLKYGGDVVGGVVILNPKLFPAKDSLLGHVVVSGISNGRGLKWGTQIAKTWYDGWFVKTGGAYQKKGDLYTPRGTLQNTGMDEKSFSFSFGSRGFMKGFEMYYSSIYQSYGIFSGAHLSSAEDFYQAIVQQGVSSYYNNFRYAISNPRQEVNHHVLKIKAYNRFYNLGKLSFSYAFQLNSRKEYDIRRGALNTLPAMDLRLITHNIALEHLLERKRWQIETGIVGNWQDNYPNPETKARRLIPDYYRCDTGIFSIFRYHWKPRTKIELGLRYDINRYDVYKYYDQSVWRQFYAVEFPHFEVKTSGSRILTRPLLTYYNASVNAGLAYRFRGNSEFKINLSHASRAPNVAELFADGLHHSAAIIEKGSLSMNREEIYHANFLAKTNLNIGHGLLLQINPYLMFSPSFIHQVPTGFQNSNRGNFMIWSFQQIKALIYGLDAEVNFKLNGKITWNTQVAMLRGQDKLHREDLILMMPTNIKNDLEWNLHKSSLFFLKLEHEYVAKQRYYPRREMKISLIENGQIVDKVLDVGATPEAYHLFHFSLGVRLFRNLDVDFRMSNIFDKEYRAYLNRLRYFAPEMGRNTVLTFKYNF